MDSNRAFERLRPNQEKRKKNIHSNSVKEARRRQHRRSSRRHGGRRHRRSAAVPLLPRLPRQLRRAATAAHPHPRRLPQPQPARPAPPHRPHLPHLPRAPRLPAPAPRLPPPPRPAPAAPQPIRVYLHHPSGTLLAAAHGAVPAHRARAAAKALVSKLQPGEVLVLDAVRSASYRGRLAADEPVEGKLETSAARARGGVGAARGVPGSVVDGLGAAVLAECEIRGKAATMVVTWPAGARPSEFAVMRRVAAELGVDTNKVAARISGRAELDALYT
ncbi:hypothetical protein PVAP13_9KG334000 [Panicum virgatum]|uniref:Uncharacterized protein n=1 Tax=Panicum virgatum TaxID=38727 RepID=A0A8T0NQJ5_PANVG|nr:hypothetical protein PVAP13_9KG334000 [Panicum virgatum]